MITAMADKDRGMGCLGAAGWGSRVAGPLAPLAGRSEGLRVWGLAGGHWPGAAGWQGA